MYELFPAFIFANNIGSLVNSSFGVKIFILFPYFTSLSLSSGGMSDKSPSSAFCLLNFTLSAIVPSDCHLLSSSYILCHLSYLKSLVNKLLGSQFLSISSFLESMMSLYFLK